MTLTFTVRDPIPTNAAYGTSRFRRGMYLKDAGKAFKRRVTCAAAIAKGNSREWPANPWRVAKARVSFQLYDYRGDTDGPRKLIRDAMERLVYVNDRIVADGPADLPIMDGDGRRVVITVELLELLTPAEAEKALERSRKRELANMKRRIRAAEKRTADKLNKILAG